MPGRFGGRSTPHSSRQFFRLAAGHLETDKIPFPPCPHRCIGGDGVFPPVFLYWEDREFRSPLYRMYRVVSGLYRIHEKMVVVVVLDGFNGIGDRGNPDRLALPIVRDVSFFYCPGFGKRKGSVISDPYLSSGSYR